MGDGGFGNPTFLALVFPLTRGKRIEGKRIGFLLRTAKNRTLYHPAPPRTGKRGVPRKDGERFSLSAPTTHGLPDQEWAGDDDQGRACRLPAGTICTSRSTARLR